MHHQISGLEKVDFCQCRFRESHECGVEEIDDVGGCGKAEEDAPYLRGGMIFQGIGDR